MSQVHDQKEHSLQSHLNYEGITIFIGGSEVVLNSFDDISLDILLFLESNGSSVDKLSIFILSNGGRARCLDLTFLNFGRKEGDSSDEIRQHIDDINWLIKPWIYNSIIPTK